MQLEDLPEELLTIIFSKLRLKDLAKCDVVSRRFHGIRWNSFNLIHKSAKRINGALRSRHMGSLSRFFVIGHHIEEDIEWDRLETSRSSLRELVLFSPLFSPKTGDIWSIIDGFPRLQKLVLVSAAPACVSASSSLPGLKSVTLSRAENFRAEDLYHLLQAAPLLETLIINNLKDMEGQVIIQGDKLKEVAFQAVQVELTLKNCESLEKVSIISTKRFSIIGRCSGIRQLSLERISNLELSELLSRSPYLKKLSIKQCLGLVSPISVCSCLLQDLAFAPGGKQVLTLKSCSGLKRLEINRDCLLDIEGTSFNICELHMIGHWQEEDIVKLVSLQSITGSLKHLILEMDTAVLDAFHLKSSLTKITVRNEEELQGFAEREELQGFAERAFSLYPGLQRKITVQFQKTSVLSLKSRFKALCHKVLVH